MASNGSVITLFQKQIAKGGLVTVTDSEMTRYFMTISEAVQLILQASAMGNGGEVFILDMGEPVKVVDMARHLIRLSGFEPDKDIAIKLVGRRPGEKMFEELWNEDEKPVRTEFDKILAAQSNGLGGGGIIRKLQQVLRHAERMEREKMFAKMQELIPEYRRDGG